jgi:predicted RNA-binding protein with PUA-like domain
VRYREHLPNEITLKDIKSQKSFANMELVTRARLSIQHVSQKDAERLLKQGRQ